ncbi:hypothetical protein EZV62_008739 [Acer yangbiense]|uniref:Uncharacterized protein n=1 Tax=Acer yangbiense TaxID=1000413 RepID=A0A5C7IEP6_9ROSI|nr:hypothetical protein EZV62_008739 [Acer yangbiense]
MFSIRKWEKSFLVSCNDIRRLQKLPKDDSDDQKVSFVASFIKAIMPIYTLEELLLASPDSVLNSYSYGDESMSKIMKNLLEVDNGSADEGDNHRGKIKKRVS